MTEMDKAFRATLIQILGPLAARHMRPVEDGREASVPVRDPKARAMAAYQQAVLARNFVAAYAMRERLKTLETETLLTLAESHAVSRRASAVRPLISGVAEAVRAGGLRKNFFGS